MNQPQSRSPCGQVYSFGPFTLDPGRGTLLRDTREVKLRPKSFELLRYLAENPGRLIGKLELMQALWQDTVVGDDALPHCVMEVRKALGNDGQRLIKTVPARGYIFEAKFNRPQAVAIELPTKRVNEAPLRVPYFAAAAIALVLLAGFAVWRAFRLHSAHESVSRIEELTRERRYFEAYELAAEAIKYLPDDKRLLQWMPDISDDLTVHSTPALAYTWNGSVRIVVRAGPETWREALRYSI